MYTIFAVPSVVTFCCATASFMVLSILVYFSSSTCFVRSATTALYLTNTDGAFTSFRFLIISYCSISTWRICESCFSSIGMAFYFPVGVVHADDYNLQLHPHVGVDHIDDRLLAAD